MDIINRCLTLDEFEDYVRSYYFGSLPANKLVIHHTWRPTAEGWSGKRTIMGLKRYYEGKGWSAGPHLFIAEDGIWLFSPMRKDGIHAASLNHRSIGIEVVGDYDHKKWEGETKYNTLGVIKVLMQYLHFANKDIFFHRDASTKSCPGWAITKEWLFESLNYFQRRPRLPGSSEAMEAVEHISAPLPEGYEGEIMIPEWAVEAVTFIKQHQLFQIKTEADIRDAVKFYRFYQLIRQNHG